MCIGRNNCNSYVGHSYTSGEGGYVIIGSHFVPLEGKLLLIELVIVMITLNVCPSFKHLLPNSQTLRQCYFHLLRNRQEVNWIYN